MLDQGWADTDSNMEFWGSRLGQIRTWVFTNLYRGARVTGGTQFNNEIAFFIENGHFSLLDDFIDLYCGGQ